MVIYCQKKKLPCESSASLSGLGETETRDGLFLLKLSCNIKHHCYRMSKSGIYKCRHQDQSIDKHCCYSTELNILLKPVAPTKYKYKYCNGLFNIKYQDL